MVATGWPDSIAGSLLDGRYQLTHRLGEGGFATTYLAVDTRLPGHPQCVVKHLRAPADPVLYRQALRLFRTEAEVLQLLGRHDRIPQLYAFLEERGELYLVQEYLEGQTLADELAEVDRFSVANTVALLSDVVTVLQVVHAAGWVHQDIKPANLLRRQYDGAIALLDFGNAKFLPAVVETLPDDRIPLGTPGYLAPEQAAGCGTPQSDLYAAAAVSLQALTGIHPIAFPRDEQGRVLWDETWPQEAELRRILLRALDPSPRRRYPDAQALLADLANLPYHRATPPAVVPTPLPKLRWWLAMILAGVGMLSATIAELWPQPPAIASWQTALAQALARQQWAEADRLTYEGLAGPGLWENSQIRPSCADVRAVDRLWQEASAGRLGFTPQIRVWQRATSSTMAAIALGWQNAQGRALVATRYDRAQGRWVYVLPPQFQNPPVGHLPYTFRESEALRPRWHNWLTACLQGAS
ncbi:MAG: protein kinase domain-containing protein [Pseudanabaenaceae cyanobacterium]